MNEPFHELNPAEQERLALLAEECAEVIQIIGKIWRHGYNSTHPDNPDGPDNRQMLQTEIGHIAAAQHIMVEQRDLRSEAITHSMAEKLKAVSVYLHHQ